MKHTSSEPDQVWAAVAASARFVREWFWLRYRAEAETNAKWTNLDLDEDLFADSMMPGRSVSFRDWTCGCVIPLRSCDKSDPWQASVGIAVRSRRAIDAHSGTALQFQCERQTLAIS